VTSRAPDPSSARTARRRSSPSGPARPRCATACWRVLPPAFLGFVAPRARRARRARRHRLPVHRRRHLRIAMVSGAEFAEWAWVHGNRSGTTAAAVREALDEGPDVLSTSTTRVAPDQGDVYSEAVLCSCSPRRWRSWPAASATAPPRGRGDRAAACRGPRRAQALRPLRLPESQRRSQPRYTVARRVPRRAVRDPRMGRIAERLVKESEPG